MRFEDFYVNSSQSKQIKSLHEGNIFKKVTSDQAYDLAINLSSTNKPIPKELEDIIATDPHNAYFYAKYIVKGRFPQGEPEIMSNLSTKANYIRFLNKIGYEDLEESFENYFNNTVNESYTSLDPDQAYKVAEELVDNSEPVPPELQDVIATSAENSFFYARDIIHQRFSKGEKVIAEHPSYARMYARDVIGDRWPEVEELIAKSSEGAYYYATDVVKGRFIEGEPAILKSSYRDNYVKFLNEIGYEEVDESFKRFFTEATRAVATMTPLELYKKAKKLGKRLPEYEYILFHDIRALVLYSINVYAPEMRKLNKNPRWPLAERYIVKSDHPALTAMYARDVIGGRWPELEKFIIDCIDLDLTLSDATIFQTVMYYIYEVVKGRWKEIEPILSHYDEYYRNYIDFLNSIGYEDDD